MYAVPLGAAVGVELPRKPPGDGAGVSPNNREVFDLIQRVLRVPGAITPYGKGASRSTETFERACDQDIKRT